MSRREKVWLAALVLFAVGLLVASWWVNEQTDRAELIDAAGNGNTAEVAVILAEGVDINAVSRLECTALYYAANRGNAETIRLLLAHGADPTISCSEAGGAWVGGSTPIHVAAANVPEIIPDLLRHGASVHTRDDAGSTPLHWAAQRLNADAVRLLLEHGADPKARNKLGELPAEMPSNYYLPGGFQEAKLVPGVKEIYQLLGPPTPVWTRLARGLP